MAAPSLLRRLKERKLVQWALAYLAGAWALVEATSLVAQQFHWPDFVGRAVTVGAFFGLLLTLVLAWYHGEKGRQRISVPELLLLALVLLVGGTGIVVAGRGGETTAATEELAAANGLRLAQVGTGVQWVDIRGDLSLIASALGDEDQQLYWFLEAAHRGRHGLWPILSAYPWMDRIRARPEFQAWVRETEQRLAAQRKELAALGPWTPEAVLSGGGP